MIDRINKIITKNNEEYKTVELTKEGILLRVPYIDKYSSYHTMEICIPKDFIKKIIEEVEE